MACPCPLRFSSYYHLLPEHVVFDASVGRKGADKNVEEPFVKEACWSPDGSTVMAVAGGDCMSFFGADPELVTEHQYYKTSTENKQISATRNMKASQSYTGLVGESSKWHMGSTVVDSSWYPFMNSTDPASSCYLTACRDKPIHLWNYDLISSTCDGDGDGDGDGDRWEASRDAASASARAGIKNTNTPTSRCSYRCYNQYDEVETVQAISFNSTGDKIYACTKNLIRIFDVNTPGRNCTEIPTIRFKKDPMGMFKGLISSIVFGPDPSTKVYSCATYSNSIAVYVEGSKESVLMLTDVPTGCGITCQRWNPNGNHLWVGGRHSSDIICYDLRSTRGELGRVTRKLETNQRLTFDMDPWGKYLITGSQDGEVLVYDAIDFSLQHRIVDANANANGMDCTNSVTCHPHSALLCVTTGQRFIGDDSDDDEDEDDAGGSGSDRMNPEGLGASSSKSYKSSGLRLLAIGAENISYPVDSVAPDL